MELKCGDRRLPLDSTAIMGVLNVTPDSFSDGGLWLDPEAALRHAIDMVAEGADIVDVGGESTRPGATAVPEEEELRRVLPVIEALAGELAAPISIDTRKPAVADAALTAGASILNDTSGEEMDPAMDEVAAGHGAGLVIMHSRGNPSTMKSLTDYDDVVRHVTSFLTRRADQAVAAGVPTDSIALDPGIGFAKTAEQSLRLLGELGELVGTGWPVVVGTSRKSFIGTVLGVTEDERVEGTAASVAWAVACGAHIIRVHDVRPMTRVVRMTEAIVRATAEPRGGLGGTADR